MTALTSVRQTLNTYIPNVKPTKEINITVTETSEVTYAMGTPVVWDTDKYRKWVLTDTSRVDGFVYVQDVVTVANKASAFKIMIAGNIDTEFAYRTIPEASQDALLAVLKAQTDFIVTDIVNQHK